MGSVRDIDRGAKVLLRRAASMREASVWAGVLPDRGAVKHNGPTDLTVLEVATIQEFGTLEGIPARSFIRAWFDANVGTIEGWMRNCTANVLSGRLSKEGALAYVGKLCVDAIKARMRAGIAPQLADPKANRVPLIKTGQLIDSIAFKVRP